MKELQILEASIFDVVENLHKSLQCNNLEDYRLGLAVLDQLNGEYNMITGSFYINPMDVLTYHQKQWENFV